MSLPKLREKGPTWTICPVEAATIEGSRGHTSRHIAAWKTSKLTGRHPARRVLMLAAAMTLFALAMNFKLVSDSLSFRFWGYSQTLCFIDKMPIDTTDNTSKALFPVKPLVIWSSDYHISPIADLKFLLRPLGVRFIDKSLSGHCSATCTCDGRRNLRVIDEENAMSLDEPSLFDEFYESYKNDPEMQSVDAFVCFHSTAMCELFAQFNKTLLIIASTRYELGRFGRERWSRWNENLVRYASIPGNVVGGNNLYDVEYIRYFTGLENVRLLPSYCGYVSKRYSPVRDGFLLAPVHSSSFEKLFWTWLEEAFYRLNVPTSTALLSSVRTLYSYYQYEDLAAHPGIVYVPYQVSVMSLFEQYRMNIPLWFPSVRLLTEWQLEYQVMNERTWDGVNGTRPTQSSIEAHPSQRHVPDPNDEQNRTAIEYWLKFSDFYRWPHIFFYDSIEDLVRQLTTISRRELLVTSKRMASFNAKVKDELVQQWTTILRNIAAVSPNKPH